LPCPSIFDTGAEIMAKHGLRAVRPLAKNTLARVARGMKRYVIESERPFLVNLTHGGRVEDAADPFKTITGAHRGEKAVVVPTIVGCGGRAGQSRPRGGDEPFATVTSKADACVTTAHLMSLNGTARRDSAADAPHPTVLAGGGHSALVAPTLANVANSKTTGRGPNAWSVTEPLRTITSANGHAAVAPYLASIAHGDSGGRREYPMADPLGTVTVGGIQHALIAPVLTYAQQGGANRSMADPHHTICASKKDQNSLIAATMVHVGNVERAGQLPRVLDVRAPLNTVVAGGVKQYPVAAFLAQQNGGPRMGAHCGHDPRDPISTIAGSGSHQTPIAAFIARQFGASTGHAADAPLGTTTAGGQGKSQLVAPWFAKYYGTGDGARTDQPCHTVTVKDRMAHMQAELTAPPFGPEHQARAREVAEFLRSHDAWDGGEYVTLSVDGAEFVVVDIGMRMLTPRELFRAQGFPDDYVIEGVWDTGSGWENLGHNGGPRFIPFPKDVQVSCCGNSVCPPLAEAIVSANCGHIAVAAEEATA
jgi:DNA (cytosine-5)-methyltransferase 1